MDSISFVQQEFTKVRPILSTDALRFVNDGIHRELFGNQIPVIKAVGMKLFRYAYNLTVKDRYCVISDRPEAYRDCHGAAMPTMHLTSMGLALSWHSLDIACTSIDNPDFILRIMSPP